MSKVRFFRTKNNITQTELAEQTAMTATELSLVENDKLLPTPPKARRLCKILNVNLGDLYTRKELTFYHDYRTGDASISNLSVRLDADKRKTYLSDEVIKRLGYKSIKEWIQVKALETFNEYREEEREDMNTTIFEYDVKVQALGEINGRTEDTVFEKHIEIEAIDDSAINTELAKRIAIRKALETAEIAGVKLLRNTLTVQIIKTAVKGVVGA